MSEDVKTPAPDHTRVADSPEKNWVDEFCPLWLRPYLRLSRADRPIGTWLLLIPCWWGVLLALMADPQSLGWFDLWIAFGCAVGAFLMRGAGCTWNDILDRHIDAQVARTKSRPLPSGQVSVKQALIWMGIQTLIAFGILLTFNTFAIVLSIAALIPVAVYPLAKRFTWWPQIFLGIAFNWGALVGWAAHTGGLEWPAILLYMSGISWTLFYDTIYAHQDKEDDALIGVKSTARLFADATSTWLLIFIAMTAFLMSCAVLHVFYPSLSLMNLLIGFAGIVVFTGHLIQQWWRLDINDARCCLKLFRTNRDAGLLLVLMWGILLILQVFGFDA